MIVISYSENKAINDIFFYVTINSKQKTITSLTAYLFYDTRLNACSMQLSGWIMDDSLLNYSNVGQNVLRSAHRTSQNCAVSPLRVGWGLTRGRFDHQTWGNHQLGWSSTGPWDPQCGWRRSEEPPPWLPADCGQQLATPPHEDHQRTQLHSDPALCSAQQSPSRPCARHLKGKVMLLVSDNVTGVLYFLICVYKLTGAPWFSVVCGFLYQLWLGPRHHRQAPAACLRSLHTSTQSEKKCRFVWVFCCL